MALNQHAWTTTQIRAAEQTLLDSQAFEDELMISAARGVAEVARVMLADSDEVRTGPKRILVLTGSGGNGGDALYAVAQLLEPTLSAYQVDAVLLGRDGKAHERALEAFTRAGGRILDDQRLLPHGYDLIIDGVLGLGGEGGLEPETALRLEALHHSHTPILAVDVPSGIGADSGNTPPAVEKRLSEDYSTDVPGHVSADVTVTFGGLRNAHGLSPHCGEVVLVDAQTHSGQLSAQLIQQVGSAPLVTVGNLQEPSRYSWPETVHSLRHPFIPDLQPEPEDDKYSGGVVGIAAGSGTYPGAAVLSTLGALRATSPMVRYAGPQALEVVRAAPEVIATETIDAAGRVQAWVYGPGSGTESPQDLSRLLDTDLPLLIDADGLTLLAQHPELRDQLRARRPATVLTPHAGEFQRLAEAVGRDYSGMNRVDATCDLAVELQSAIILKGRSTVVVHPTGDRASATIIDAGSSWAATPGSGDVLSGITGALMAWMSGRGVYATGGGEDEGFRVEYQAMETAVTIHAMASFIAALTPDGPAPTSASRIAEAIPAAIARLRKGRHYPRRGAHILPTTRR